ncbi:MAG TPA: crossover junction endodeoxyribonuclease RuvC [bacterium]|jgi:crossover junction endodeoxyribonuclease RuvC|nr:crossover junction endodeoxyribonuclease RuvC [bacterium]
MIVLGVDPGLRATGYGVVEGSSAGIHVVAFGVVRSADGAGLSTRLLEIHQHLSAIVGTHRPALLAVEDLYTAQRFPRTAILMGHVRGIICLAAAQGHVDVLALPPAAVKHAITGFGAATKPQMQAAVRRLLGLPSPVDGHAADALAMALTALSRAGYALRPRALSGGVAP